MLLDAARLKLKPHAGRLSSTLGAQSPGLAFTEASHIECQHMVQSNGKDLNGSS